MITPTRYRGPLAAVGVVTLMLGGLANPLRAQQAASSSLYGGSLFDRSTLTGDWGGARDVLAAQGITVAPSFTQFYQGPTAGNTKHTFDYGDKADLFINIDGEKVGLWRGFSIQIHGEYNFGLTPGEVGGTSIPNNTAMSFPVQNQSGGDLSSVFFTQRFGPNFTIVAGKMNMFDFYASGHQFNGGRGIESFWNTAFVGPPSGTVPVSAFGMIASYKIDPLTFTGMVYDPHDALNRTGFERPFSQGVTFRGSADLSSSLLGLPRTDGLAFAVSSEKGTDFSSLPYANRVTTSAADRDLVRDCLTEGSFWRALHNPHREVRAVLGRILIRADALAEPNKSDQKLGIVWANRDVRWQSQLAPVVGARRDRRHEPSFRPAVRQVRSGVFLLWLQQRVEVAP